MPVLFAVLTLACATGGSGGAGGRARVGGASFIKKEGADVPNEKLKKTVADAGFEAAAIVRSFGSEHEDWHPENLPGKGGVATAGTGR